MREVKRFARQRLKQIIILLEAYPASRDPNILHRVRVEIKKIKAILRLLHDHKKNFDDHQAYKPFRSIFRACGVIWEPFALQQNRSIGDVGYSTNNHELENFESQISDFIRTIKVNSKVILRRTDSISKKSFQKYLRKRKTELMEWVYPRFLLKQLHTIRKRMKELLYLNAIHPKNKKLTRFLKECSEIIGKWHDRLILIEIQKKRGRQTDIARLRSTNKEDLKKLKTLIRSFYS